MKEIDRLVCSLALLRRGIDNGIDGLNKQARAAIYPAANAVRAREERLVVT